MRRRANKRPEGTEGTFPTSKHSQRPSVPHPERSPKPMSTLLGIKRVSDGKESAITVDALAEYIGKDPAVSWIDDEKKCLRWSDDDRSTFFNFSGGEIWTVETPDDACLKKIQELALALGAKIVDESGEVIEPEELSPVGDAGPREKKSILFRVYIILLIGAAVAWYIYSRR